MVENEKALAYYMDNDDHIHLLTTASQLSIRWAGRNNIIYGIDGHDVPVTTYNKACELIRDSKKPKEIKAEKDVVSYATITYNAMMDRYKALGETARNLFDEKKEEETMKKNEWIHTMPSIKNHKYIKDHGVTIIEWNDGTVTKVVCDPMIADEFTGYCAAIAKRAMGNGGKMLSEWERLVIKPEEDKRKAEEKAKIEAEQKAEEEKKRAEAKAKRDAKKAKRKAERAEIERQKAIEEIAEIFAKDYAESDLYEKAAKLAVEKYGVPKGFFTDIHECNCKEFDNLNDDNKE